jgi:S-adenosylmethionine decarboxylase
LNDQELILGCLNELPELLGMHKLSQPVVYEASDNGKKDPGGWSGFVVIAESHISIHTFPANGFVTIDAYTCKNGLDMRYVVTYFVEKFWLKETETNFVERGKKYAQLAEDKI